MEQPRLPLSLPPSEPHYCTAQSKKCNQQNNLVKIPVLHPNSPSSLRYRVIITLLLADLRASHTFIYLCRLCAVSTSSTTYLFWTLPATYSFSIFGTVRTLNSLASFPSSTYVSHTHTELIWAGCPGSQSSAFGVFYIYVLFLDVWEEVIWDRLGWWTWKFAVYWPSHCAEKQEGSLSLMSRWCNLSCLALANLCPCYKPVSSPGCCRCRLVSSCCENKFEAL